MNQEQRPDPIEAVIVDVDAGAALKFGLWAAIGAGIILLGVGVLLLWIGTLLGLLRPA